MIHTAERPSYEPISRTRSGGDRFKKICCHVGIEPDNQSTVNS